MDAYDELKLAKDLKYLIERRVFKGNKYIVLYGMSTFIKSVNHTMNTFGLKADAVVDNNPQKIGREFEGFVVQATEDVLKDFKDNAVILIYSIYNKEIASYLETFGYKKKQHIFILSEEKNDSLPCTINYVFRICRGFWAFRQLKNKYSAAHAIIIAPYTGIGDIYLIGVNFNEYISQQNIDKYIFITVSGACRKVAELFGIINIEIMPQRFSDELILCNQFLRGTLEPIHILNDSWSAEYTNPLQWLRGYKGLNFNTTFQHFVFGFAIEPPKQLPLPPEDADDKITEIFKKNELIPGKTVVLSPYSNTLFQLPDEFWEEISDYCRTNGFTLCTNSAGDAEPAVAGAPAVFFPLNMAIKFMDTAGYFIGVRSGFCDVISSSKCKKAIIYEKDGMFYQSSTYEYFNLRDMGLCDDALEVEYRSDVKEKVIVEIKKMLSNKSGKLYR